MTMPTIPIKAYKKCDLKILLMNPSINLKDERAVSEAIPMHSKKFVKLLDEKLKGKVPEKEYKRAYVLPEQWVRMILT